MTKGAYLPTNTSVMRSEGWEAREVTGVAANETSLKTGGWDGAKAASADIGRIRL